MRLVFVDLLWKCGYFMWMCGGFCLIFCGLVILYLEYCYISWCVVFLVDVDCWGLKKVVFFYCLWLFKLLDGVFVIFECCIWWFGKVFWVLIGVIGDDFVYCDLFFWWFGYDLDVYKCIISKRLVVGGSVFGCLFVYRGIVVCDVFDVIGIYV